MAGAMREDKTVIAQTEYDLIEFSNVLEHVPYPIDTLAEIYAETGRETLLYIEVPHEDGMRANLRSLEIYRQRKHWHEHINFFSEGSIKPMLNQSGLDVLDIKEIQVTAGGRDACIFSIACKLSQACGSSDL